MASMVNSNNTIVPEMQEQDVNMLNQNAINVKVSENENILYDDTNEKVEARIDIKDSKSLSDEDIEEEEDLEDFIDDADADEDSTDEEDIDDDYIDEEDTNDDF
ncbi:hypothetical protein Tco_0295231 [Tanacetum coccineum]